MSMGVPSKPLCLLEIAGVADPAIGMADSAAAMVAALKVEVAIAS